MKGNRILGASAALLLVFGAATGAQAYVKSTWFNAANAPHKAVNGETTFKAVCDNPAAATMEVTLAGAPVAGGIVTDSYAIESDWAYGLQDGVYTITVKDAGGATIGFDTYAVTVVSGTTAEIEEIAIENGLWYLHKTMTRYDTIPNGAPGGFHDYNGDPVNNPRPDPSALMAGQAFVDAGHNVMGNDDNPYVEDVKRIVNWTTEHLGIMSFTANPKDGGADPEDRLKTYATPDRMGVLFNITDGSSEIEYGFGPALKFLATCGYAKTSGVTVAAYNDALNCGTGASIQGYTFARIVQEMIDFIAWAQLDTKGNSYVDTGVAFCPTKSGAAVAPGSKGGWPYWNEGWKVDPADDYNALTGGDGTYGDVAIAYWTALGLDAAETYLGNDNVIPPYVKQNLLPFVSNHINPITGEIPFGPAHNIHLIERAGQGLSLLKFVNVDAATDSRVAALASFITKNWGKHTYHHEQGHPDQSYICHDEYGTEKQCYQHYLVDANPVGFWVCNRYANPELCVYEIIETLDDINLFAFKTVTEGLGAYPALAPVPEAAPADHKTIYRDLLLRNQLSNGGWDDHGWVQGYQPMGASWAISLLAKSL